MDTAAYALLIIVSTVLSIFLILACIALIYFIRILKRANQVADSVESAATAVKRSASAAPFVKLVNNLFDRQTKKGGKHDSSK